MKWLVPLAFLGLLTGCSGSMNGPPPAQVVRVDVTATVLAVEFAGETSQFRATPVNAQGSPVVGTTVTWSSSNPVVATVDANGLVTAQGFGAAEIRATVGAVTGRIQFEVIGDRFFLNGSVRLRYDLDLPDNSGGPFPAVVWVHGSGMLDRNSQALATNPLVPEGLAALRYDKRGVGQSTGSFFNIGVANSVSGLGTLASDAAAAVRFLTRLPQIDRSRIGIIGNSQGGWIGPIAAAQSSDVSFMMMWSGPTVSVGLEIFYSTLADGTNTPLDNVYAQLPGFNGAAGYDPLPTLQSLTIPSLWLYGGMDRSIPTRLDTLNMRNFQAMGLPYEFIWYPTGRHDLRDANTGMIFDVWSDQVAWMRAKGIL